MRKQKKQITPFEIRRMWEVWRNEHYLSATDFAFLAGADVSGIYKKIKDGSLKCEEINNENKIILNDFENLIYLEQLMRRNMENMNAYETGPDGTLQYDKNYLELEALVGTVSRMIGNMRLDFAEHQRATVAELTNFEILQKKFSAVIKLIHDGTLSTERVKSLVDATPEIIAVHESVVNCAREAASGMLTFKR